ncbi:hypothetical protein GJ629_05705 [Halapricum sp. CBA1109]|uniref:hypothetical protein n=1 Tax=Halapricum sp. CBA1109 TaxID=2668068 RepID=UPI0012F7697F|nr:hypothetical protein [Halapricum sp. CBA1109]MUV89453.1 hypothetical protein [Halapricum sp. CBA1109]
MTGDSGEKGDSTVIDRRRVLGLLGTTGAIGLAGCNSDTGSGGDDEDDESDPNGTTPTGTVGGGTGGVGATTTVQAKALSALPSGSCEQSPRTSETTLEAGPRIESDTTLGSDADVILVESLLTVTSGTTLTVEPGTTLAFGEGASLQIEGTLSAAGSCSSPIVLTGTADRAGYWQGIRFGRNGGGTLDHVLLENGGTDRVAAVDLQSDGIVSMTNTEVRGAAGDAVVVAQSGAFGSFSGNALADNAGVAFRGTVRAAAALDEATAYGDADDRPIVVAASEVPEGETISVGPAGVPYTVAPGGLGGITVAGTLAVAPGTAMEFGSDGYLTVAETGELTADAGGGDPITFGGTQETRGFWSGVAFARTDSTANVLRNVVVRDAGARDDGQGLHVTGNTRLTVEDCRFSNNDATPSGSGRTRRCRRSTATPSRTTPHPSGRPDGPPDSSARTTVSPGTTTAGSTSSPTSSTATLSPRTRPTRGLTPASRYSSNRAAAAPSASSGR